MNSSKLFNTRGLYKSTTKVERKLITSYFWLLAETSLLQCPPTPPLLEQETDLEHAVCTDKVAFLLIPLGEGCGKNAYHFLFIL